MVSFKQIGTLYLEGKIIIQDNLTFYLLEEGKRLVHFQDKNLKLEGMSLFDISYSLNEADWYIFEDEDTGLFGMNNNYSTVVIEPKYEELQDFKLGLAAVRQGEKWGFINTKNEVVIPIIYDSLLDFEESGLANVRQGEKWGWINRKNEVVIPIIYDEEGDGLEYLEEIDEEDENLGEIDEEPEYGN